MVTTRRLTAILAADVAAYSRLMEEDEEGTHERLKAYFQHLINPEIAAHHGRVVKTTGDGALAEFASVVDAVRCAAEIQRAMLDRDMAMPEERRIRFRIGVNLGDIIVEDGDIFGDGVNVAARLEALAEPGEICVSGTVHDQIRDKLPYSFDDLGEQRVKNIARPVRVYALRSAAVAALPAASAPPATLIPQPAVAPRLSIVVLPFANLSSDPEQQYFADGITEDVTTDLSRIAGMLVISRNTAFTYQNKRVDTKQVGRELGVRYVLEGSVRRSGNRVRVNAQLIDATTDAHLWAERFDGDTSDLFALRDEITARIGNTLNLELTAAEAARPSERPDALDYILRGRAARLKPNSPDVYAEAISLFEHAWELDPQSIEAQTRLAASLVSRVIDGMTDSAGVDLARADELIGRVLAGSPRYADAHFAKGQLLRARGRCREAILEYEMVLVINPNEQQVLHALGWCKLLTGAIEEVIPLEKRAIRLSPRAPHIGFNYARIGLVHLLLSRTEKAIMWLEKAVSCEPEFAPSHAWLASAYALKGETQRAAAELAEARRLSADDRYTSIARLRAVGSWGVPKVRALFETTSFVGLRKAGVLEE
jgi:adenylate cyclase